MMVFYLIGLSLTSILLHLFCLQFYPAWIPSSKSCMYVLTRQSHLSHPHQNKATLSPPCHPHYHGNVIGVVVVLTILNKCCAKHCNCLGSLLLGREAKWDYCASWRSIFLGPRRTTASGNLWNGRDLLFNLGLLVFEGVAEVVTFDKVRLFFVSLCLAVFDFLHTWVSSPHSNSLYFCWSCQSNQITRPTLRSVFYSFRLLMTQF